MARTQRLEVAGATYLVTARAARGEVLFGSQAEYGAFRELLARACRRYRWQCLAFSLCTRRYALLLRPEGANLATGMRFLNSTYSQGCRRRPLARGQVFDGRYEAQLVDASRALPEAGLCVLRAPLEDGIVDTPEDWEWSSHAVLLGLEAAPDWQSPEPLLAALADDVDAARQRYLALCRANGPLAKCGRRLHDPAFLAAMRTTSGQQTAEPPGRDARGDERVVALSRLAAQYGSRRAAMRAAYGSGFYSQRDIARFFGVHAATVSRALDRDQPWRSVQLAPLAWPQHGLLH